MTDGTANRYPFTKPYGWFAVSETDELAVSQAKAAFYWDTHLVVWRDETGEAHVQDAFCPHLGAHLGHGGVVKECQLECPFHGWLFDGEAPASLRGESASIGDTLSPQAVWNGE